MSIVYTYLYCICIHFVYTHCISILYGGRRHKWAVQPKWLVGSPDKGCSFQVLGATPLCTHAPHLCCSYSSISQSQLQRSSGAMAVILVLALQVGPMHTCTIEETFFSPADYATQEDLPPHEEVSSSSCFCVLEFYPGGPVPRCYSARRRRGHSPPK